MILPTNAIIGQTVIDDNNVELVHTGDNHWIRNDTDGAIQWKRSQEYPKIEDQLDMLWHMMDQDVIPGKDSIWYNSIKTVKDTNPKSSNV